MYIHNIDPVFLSIGPFEIRYYGLVYVLGFIAGYYILMWYQKKGFYDLTKEDVENLLLYVMLGVILGARLGEIMWEPAYYLSNPINILKIWEGGMSFHGGIAGVAIAVYFFTKKYKVPYLVIGDILSIPATIALAFGRMANFINGELFGTPSNLPWCVKFPGAEECRHPIQFYAAIGRGFFSALLIFIAKKGFKPGFLTFVMIFLTGVGRFVGDFLREDQRWLGLSLGQYLSLAMILIGGYFLYKNYKEELKNFFSKPST
ncbi:prolipoprotein diacylglyceryl transferase [Nanoarchaeota archaeon]